ncbi:MAG: VWA domain-containing protein [Gammaproteobacteria bacterium]|nr:VWA domain-containing protein [Gammaproteobacteria bacterium]
MVKLKNFLASLLLSGMLVSGSGIAEDIEIYFGGIAATANAVRPNVLFVLDTSSSMNNTDGTGITRLDRMKTALNSILDSSNNINVGLMRFHRMGGPVLYPVSYIDADANELEGNTSTPDADVVERVSSGSDDAEEDVSGTVQLASDKLDMGEVAAGSGTTISVRVNSDADDVEERVSDAYVYWNSSDLELPRDGSTQQIVGVRFNGVAIPAGATVTSASIEFEVDQYKTGVVDMDIWGDLSGNALAFTKNASAETATKKKVSTRTKTSKVDWNDLASPARNSKLTTPDLTSIVQEIVDLGGAGGWADGNSMVFIFEKDPLSAATGFRELESYGGESTAAPLLRITYASGAAGNQTVGVRFASVEIPQGATITSASLEFTAGNIDTDATKLRIYGENDASGNSNTFSTATNDISNRTLTTADVHWDNASTPLLASWTATDTTHTSPDLKTVVQEMVDNTNWCGGNAMSFIIKVPSSGSVGKRSGYSFESIATKAPLLRVNFDNTNPPATATGCINQTITARVSTGSDDAEESVTGAMNLTSTDLELVQEASTQKVGIRFRNLTIPQGATVISADITFTTDETSSVATNLDIYAQYTGDALAFTTANSNITAGTASDPRPLTAGVTWNNIPAWNVVGESGPNQTTPNLASIVQDVVNLGTWQPGNNMVFVIKGSGKRVAESFNGDAANAPRLRVMIQGGTGTGTSTLTTVRSRLKNIVDELQYKTGTPILSTLVEAARYFRGEEVLYGKQRGDAGSRSEFTRVSHFLSYCIKDIAGNVTCPGANTTGYPPFGVDRTPPCSADNPNSTACKSENIQGTPVYQTPITSECQSSYMILLSDGQGYISSAETGIYEPIQHVKSIVPTSTCGTHDSCAEDLVQAMNTADQCSLSGKQTITTYTIGFNIAGDTQFLTNLAAKGGGSFFAANSAAELATVFQNIIADILNVPSSFTAPALSVNAFNRLFNRNEVFLALFKPENEVAWHGNVKKYHLCDNSDNCTFGEILDANAQPAIGTDSKIKSTAQSYWSATVDGAEIEEGGAGEEVPIYSSRNIYSYTGVDDSPTGYVDLSLGEHAVNTTAGQTFYDTMVLDPTLLGLPSAATTANVAEVINWMRGQDVKDENGSGTTTDDRWTYHDPLHSRPIPITYGAPFCAGTTGDIVVAPGKACDGLIAGVDRDADEAVLKLLVMTNDGALRMINADDDPANTGYGGKEEWVFYPRAVLTNQKDLMDNLAGAHLYGLDGSMSIWKQDKSGTAGNIEDIPDGVIDPSIGDFVRVIFGMRRGGRNLYALDITPSTILTNKADTSSITPKFMWRILGGTGNFGSLGQTWSKPTVTDIREFKSGGNADDTQSRTVIITGGGYDTNQDAQSISTTTVDGDEVAFGTDAMGNAIYIIDPANGSRIWWASGTGSGADLVLDNMKYSIPADVVSYDSDDDGETDRLYATDVGGQVWRIDLPATLGQGGGNDKATGGRLAQISDNGATPAETDKRKFFYAVDVVQASETQYSYVKKYDIIPVVSGNRSHPLDLDVQNRVYAFRDYFVGDGDIIQMTGGVPNNYPQCINTTTELAETCNPAKPLTVTGTGSDLYDATANTIQEGIATDQAAAQLAYKRSNGWYFDLVESNGTWIGEKGLSRAITLAGKLLFTTFIPTQATNACQGSEGSGRVYAVSVYTGAAVLDLDNSGNSSGGGNNLLGTDRFQELGGGIPSEVVPVFLRDRGTSGTNGTNMSGVIGIVGTSSGAVAIDLKIGVPREKTFWFQEK